VLKKTSVLKFTLDWAEGLENQGVDVAKSFLDDDEEEQAHRKCSNPEHWWRFMALAQHNTPAVIQPVTGCGHWLML